MAASAAQAGMLRVRALDRQGRHALDTPTRSRPPARVAELWLLQAVGQPAGGLRAAARRPAQPGLTGLLDVLGSS